MYKLGDKILDNCGNKTRFLSILKAKGYNIPLGIVIDFEEFKKIIIQQNINFENIDKIQIPDELIDRIMQILPQSKLYAIRSSANIEDGRNISLAGRYTTFLNVVLDRECFKDKIKQCFLSLYSSENLEFYRKNNININNLEMNIIIQEMIESNVSGILFTLNPTNGNDTEIVIEFSKGAGEVVSGKAVPERIVYDWVEEKYIEEPKINILGDTAIRKIMNISLGLQSELGFPIDVEFGVYDSKLYIFQIRPITRVNHKEIYYRYTANSIPQSNFMWSIESKVANSTTTSLIHALKLMPDNEISKPIVMQKYARTYWNLDLLKKILLNIPGYVERNLDDDLGVMIDYLDNGKEFYTSSKKKKGFITKKNIMDSVRKQVINVDELIETKLEEVNELKGLFKENDSKENIKSNVLKILNVYYDIRSIYAWQAYITLMFKTNLNNELSLVLNRNEIKNLLLGIDTLYQNGPTLHMWDSSRKIRQDKEKLKFFEDNLDAEIFYIYRKDRENSNIKEAITDFIDEYGYRSFYSNDIIYKTYEEEILKVIKTYRDILELDDKFDPLKEYKRQNRLYEQSIEKLEETVKKNNLKNMLKDIEYTRELVKKQTKLKDLIANAQAVLRKYMLELGKIYKSEYILDNEEDIFLLDYISVINENLENIKPLVNKRKTYLQSFRNYNAQLDIFPCAKPVIQVDFSTNIKGIGASFGKVEGKACIVNDVEDLKNLKKSSILVTKYIDKDIFKNVDITEISGIVTEFGGMLCHLAINARENRVPCVVSLKDATTKIQNGQTVIVNGETGDVTVK